MVKLLEKCFPNIDLEIYEAPIYMTCEQFEINTSQRIAAFLAQVAHESANFSRLEENLNYSAEGLYKTFPKYFTGVNIMDYAKNPQKIANRVYANRMGNGPETSGDGWKFRGRGLIQITGRDNYMKLSFNLTKTLDDIIEFLVTPEGASYSAGFFWNSRNLNIYADSNDIRIITKLINGGYNGLNERTAEYNRILSILEG